MGLKDMILPGLGEAFVVAIAATCIAYCLLNTFWKPLAHGSDRLKGGPSGLVAFQIFLKMATEEAGHGVALLHRDGWVLLTLDNVERMRIELLAQDTILMRQGEWERAYPLQTGQDIRFALTEAYDRALIVLGSKEPLDIMVEEAVFQRERALA